MALFATAADPDACSCMYWRCSQREYQSLGREQRRRLLQERVDGGRAPGLLAYLDGQVVGWCSIGPREEFQRLQRSPTLKAVDAAAVWSTVCFFVHRRYRRRGVATALLQAAVEFARQQGGVVLEGYPVVPTKPTLVAASAFPGTVALFARVGFEEVARRTPARAIMRYQLQPAEQAAKSPTAKEARG